MSQKVQKYSSADGPSCFDSERMFLNAKQCFSIKSTGVKKEMVKRFQLSYVFAQKLRLPIQQRVKKKGFDGVSLGLFTPNFHLSLT